MAATISLTNILTKEVIRNLDKAVIIKPYAENKLLEGELKKQGDTVEVQILPTVNWLKGGTAGADITDSTFTVTKENLTIDKVSQIRIGYPNLTEVQYNRNLQSDIAARIGEGQARLQDQFVASFVKDADSTNKENETGVVTLSTTNILAQIENLAVDLWENNVDVLTSDVGLFMTPAHASILRQSSHYDATDKGVDIRGRGYVGMISGFKVYQSNNIPYATNLTADTNPTAADTMTIAGVTWTFVATGTAANPGEISLGASLAATMVNVRDAVNGTGTPGASTYIEVSSANRIILDNLDIFMAAINSVATDVTAIYGNGTFTTAETFTAGTNVFGNAGYLMFAMVRGSVHTAMQLDKMDIRQNPHGFTDNILGELVYGGAVLGDNRKKIATARVV